MADPPPISFRDSQKTFPTLKAVGRRFAPWADTYHFVMMRTWAEFFALAAVGYVLVNVFFALLYMLQEGAIAHAESGFEHAFYFSVQTLGTIGFGVMSPGTRYGHLVVTVESLVGIFSIALITGMTFARFARPSAKVLFAAKAVVARRDGEQYLMFRMANWRHNQILEAYLRVTVLVSHTSREGHEMRIPVDLPLVRDRTAMFGLTWLAMHKIDEKSPFHGGPSSIDRLRAQSALIFLSLTGVDETIGQNVHARHSYALDDIAWDSIFVDVLRVGDDGGRVLDYSHFHDVARQPPA
ncbi:MAG: ion channel [Deltaproteobacteria bacterium]